LQRGRFARETTLPATQSNNVGNAGDTLKHAPIPELIDMLLASSTRVACFDPFAFALETPLAVRVGYAGWHADLDGRRNLRPAYGRLLDIQARRLAGGGSYRCGIGLALDAISSDRLSWLLAAESDPDLRGRLEAALRGIGLTAALVDGAVLPDAGQTPVAIAKAGAAAQAGEGSSLFSTPLASCDVPGRESSKASRWP